LRPLYPIANAYLHLPEGLQFPVPLQHTVVEVQPAVPDETQQVPGVHSVLPAAQHV
jgi:hypothetical protein